MEREGDKRIPRGFRLKNHAKEKRLMEKEYKKLENKLWKRVASYGEYLKYLEYKHLLEGKVAEYEELAEKIEEKTS